MDAPTASFIVPCYRLAHFLGDCIDSILSQTFSDFEIIIMDDCSPDETQKVAERFQDCRIRYIRNDQNLGHLRNYNKGLSISRGKYIWIISADDRLRQPYILQRYVELLNSSRAVGYAFCPGVGLENGNETTVLPYYYHGNADKIFDGRDFIARVLRRGGGLLSPSVMARRECYGRSGVFPLDMPHQGDLYLWFSWALEYDVAYFAEPMVNYRSHDHNMMKKLLTRRTEVVFHDEVNVLWRTKRLAEEKGFHSLARTIEPYIAIKYASAAAFEFPGSWGMSINECNCALHDNTRTVPECRRIRGKFKAFYANKQWRRGHFRDAQQIFASALGDDWRMPYVWLKVLLLWAQLGRFALFLRSLKANLVRRRAGSGCTTQQCQARNTAIL